MAKVDDVHVTRGERHGGRLRCGAGWVDAL